ncbi:ATP-binding protein [Fusibacter sp. JL216-2]|uniref:hybrid sensor histidine kinase/response regulator n=1 Tax=Fusibacter sp. JL216-2 TaxID=3071453 RepID=UPI003D345D25
MDYILLSVYSAVVVLITYFATIKVGKSNETVIVKEIIQKKSSNKPYGIYSSITGMITLSVELQNIVRIFENQITLDRLLDTVDLKTATEIKSRLSRLKASESLSYRLKYTPPKIDIPMWLEVRFNVTKLGQEKEIVFEVDDITDTIELESKTWMMESTLKSIVDNTMLISFFAIDHNGKLILFNERFFQKVKSIFNYEIKKGDDLLEILESRSANDENLKSIYNSVKKYFDASTAEKFQSVEKIKINDKNTLYYECEYSPIIVQGNRVIGGIVFVRDVTMDIYMKEELIKEKQLEKNANEAKSKFLSNMGHEIRTPLNGVIGMTNLLQDTNLTSKQLYMVNIVKESGEYLLNVINDILDFSKIEAGEIALAEEVVHLADAIYKIEEMFRFKAGESNIKFTTELQSDVPMYVRLDSFRLKQILINLIGNAFKFTERGHIKLLVDIVDYKLMFTVEDTGIGIPQDKLDHIFDSFKQVSDDTTKKYGGTGLGLAITKELVELMGGRIKVSSRVGVGSVFYFSLPIIIPKEDELENFEHISAPEITSLAGINVLVAEDNRINQILMEEILSKYGCSYDIVENGIEVIEHIRVKKYNCILMDISMPEMDGVQTTKLIRKNFSQDDLPIIAVTAHATKEYKDELLEIGMNDFMTKPVDTKMLIKILSNYSCEVNCFDQDKVSIQAKDDNLKIYESLVENEIKNKVSGIDFKYIESQLMGNKALVPEIGNKIVRMMRDEIIPGIEHNLFVGKKEICLELTHKAKGSISNFGEVELLKSVRAIENAIKSDNIEQVKNCIMDMQNELELFNIEIENYKIL